MTIIEPIDSTQDRLIPIEAFDVCLIDGKTRKEVTDLYPSRADGAYYLDKLNRYLKERHGIDIKQYVIQYGGIVWPLCPGTGREVGYKAASGLGLIIRRFAPGGIKRDTCPAFNAGCDKLSKERMGENNPMHGHMPWNTGLTTVTDERLARMGMKQRGTIKSPETCEKLRVARALSPMKARHTMPHSPETCEKMRIITARRWATGGFNKGPTGIQVKMREFLNTLPLTEGFGEEVEEVYYSLDFAFKGAKLVIECDGDYFHINPLFYPDGPKDAIQRRNAGRDKAKNAFLRNRGWTVLRYWECDINAGTFKDDLICQLKRFGLLSA